MRFLALMVLMTLIVLPADAADVDSAAKDIVGAWRLDFTSPDDVKRTPTVIVGRNRDELFAWYVENGEPEPFKEVRLKDETLLLSFRPQERNGEVAVTFAAKLKEDGVCHGEAEYSTNDGDTGTFDFAGKRMSASDFDEVEKWKLSFVTPDDERHESVVTVVAKGDKLYGWYSSKDYELPAQKITKDGDKVLMSITAKAHDGASVDVTFRGTVDGDQVKGEAEYDLAGETGTFPFEAKRQP